MHVQHHDRPSLLAGKLHAVLQRPFAKGRDLYDLLWYLSDPTWPGPNLTLLDNALSQTGVAPVGAGWREAVAARIRATDLAGAVPDVRPFLESHANIEALTADNLLALLRSRPG